MKIKSDEVRIFIDPLSDAAGYKLLAGSPSQTFDGGLNEYNPSREFVPFVILPFVSTQDVNNRYTGEQPLTGVTVKVRYADGTPDVDIAYDAGKEEAAATTNSIVKDYNDWLVPDAPKWSIIFKEDVTPENPVCLIVNAKYADPITGAEKSVEFEVNLVTDTADTEQLELVDTIVDEQDRDMTIDPVRAADDAIPLSVQLYRNRAAGGLDGGVVADADATYIWEMLQDDEWVTVTPTNQIFMQRTIEDESDESDADDDQTYGKNITIGLEYIDQIKLRVRANYSPAGVASDFYSPYIYYSLRRVQSPNTLGDVVTDAGSKPSLTTIITRHIKLTDSEGDLSSALVNKYYRIDWYRRVSGSLTDVFVQRGEYMSKRADELGLTLSNIVTTKPRVYRLKCHKPICSGNYAIAYNGKIITGQNQIEV